MECRGSEIESEWSVEVVKYREEYRGSEIESESNVEVVK